MNNEELAKIASAAPTIRYTLDAQRGLVQAVKGEWVWHSDHLAALEYRTEEARKQAEEYLASLHVEGLKNNEHYRERMFIEIVRADEAAGMKRFTRVAAQRTVGGDAGYRRALEEIAAHRGKGDCINDVLDIADSALDGCHAAQPVEEAAAQADDVPHAKTPPKKVLDAMLAAGLPMCFPAAPTAQTRAAQNARLQEIRARHAAGAIGQPMNQLKSDVKFLLTMVAPTAQPTPQAAVQNEANSPQTRMDTSFEPLPDWIKLDGDATIIHGARYSNALLEGLGKALPVGQPFLLESREKDGGLCIIKLDWAVVERSGAVPTPTAQPTQAGAEPEPFVEFDGYDGDTCAPLFRILDRKALKAGMRLYAVRKK